jgi:branched-chain amino acid aminotransferase
MMDMVTAWQCDLSSEPARIIPYDLSSHPTSLDEASRNLPSGAYTTLRTYSHDQVIRLADHFERLSISARLTGLSLKLDDRKMRQAIRSIIDAFNIEQDIRLRITVDFSHKPGAIYLAAERLHLPAVEAYRQGVAVVTCGLRRENPRAKLTDFIAPASTFRLSLPAGVEEALMVDSEGRILEGLSSNFFAVRQSRLYTAGEGILTGITRTLVIDAANALAVPIQFQALYLNEIPEIQEAFITSASRGILPVRKVDQDLVGSGSPGEITCRLMTEFDRLIQRELEPI